MQRMSKRLDGKKESNLGSIIWNTNPSCLKRIQEDKIWHICSKFKLKKQNKETFTSFGEPRSDKPPMDDVNTFDHLVTVHCSAENPLVLAFIRTLIWSVPFWCSHASVCLLVFRLSCESAAWSIWSPNVPVLRVPQQNTSSHLFMSLYRFMSVWYDANAFSYVEVQIF